MKRISGTQIVINFIGSHPGCTFSEIRPGTGKADGVEEFVSNTMHKIFDESDTGSALAYLSLANSHVKQLREGADKC